jgi:hypothetical protein
MGANEKSGATYHDPKTIPEFGEYGTQEKLARQAEQYAEALALRDRLDKEGVLELAKHIVTKEAQLERERMMYYGEMTKRFGIFGRLVKYAIIHGVLTIPATIVVYKTVFQLW